MKYKTGFTKQLFSIETFYTGIIGYNIRTPFLSLFDDGRLVVVVGYAWDGASWFPDWKWIIRGSLGHDAIYQLIRMELLPTTCRREADDLILNCAREDIKKHWMGRIGLSKFPDIVWYGVHRFGFSATHPDNLREVYTAP